MNYFISTDEQIKNVKKWNKKYKWGFKTTELVRAGQHVPEWPSDELTCVVLVPYLKTVNQTFEALWEVAKEVYPNNWRSDYVKDLKLVKGVKHPIGLRWEVLDLRANFDPINGTRVTDLDRTTLAHAGVLAACVQFPNWVKAMDGHKVPYVIAGAYVIESDRVPSFSCDGGGFGASDYWADFQWDDTAMVAFREST